MVFGITHFLDWRMAAARSEDPSAMRTMHPTVDLTLVVAAIGGGGVRILLGLRHCPPSSIPVVVIVILFVFSGIRKTPPMFARWSNAADNGPRRQSLQTHVTLLFPRSTFAD
jgi:hypothetical protein